MLKIKGGEKKKREKMRTRKIIVALVGIFLIVTVMTGLAAAESVKILEDGTDYNLYSPLILDNGGTTSYNLDLKFFNYWGSSPANQLHTLTLTIIPISSGAVTTDITITATERSGVASASSTSSVTLYWYQDTAGSGGYDYIDVALVSNGPAGAKYQLRMEDVGYSSVIMDRSLEIKEVVNVPEFTTVAVPIATILGLLFFFNHRKHRRDRDKK
ncbi:MAG: PEF-CTERM sorting domain-containing protein [Spirochaetales bacterium]|nr:PEF-CTERM sorting domain-containing protein [Spirochaetales bacterium]